MFVAMLKCALNVVQYKVWNGCEFLIIIQCSTYGGCSHNLILLSTDENLL